MQTFAPILLGNTLIAGALAMAAMIVMRLGRPAIAHALWLLVLIKLVTPPIWDVGIPVPQWDSGAPILAAQDTSVIDAPIIPSPASAMPHLLEAVADQGVVDVDVAPVLAEPAPAPLPLRQAQGGPLARVTRWELPSLSTVFGVTWLAGSLLWIGFVLVRIRRFNSLADSGIEATAELKQRAAILARALELRTSPPIHLIPANISPMLWHDIRSTRLLIPEQLLRTLDPEQRDALLLHELAHLKRKDHLTRLLELFVTAIFWWHPLVWIARRGLREAEEQCCDAWVIWAMPDSARRYADALVDTLDFLAASPQSLPPGASGLGGLHSLQRRLTMIFTHTPPRRMSWNGRLAVLGLIGLLPLGLVRGQQAQLVAPADPTAPAAVRPMAPATGPSAVQDSVRASDVDPWPAGARVTEDRRTGAMIVDYPATGEVIVVTQPPPAGVQPMPAVANPVQPNPPVRGRGGRGRPMTGEELELRRMEAQGQAMTPEQRLRLQRYKDEQAGGAPVDVTPVQPGANVGIGPVDIAIEQQMRLRRDQERQVAAAQPAPGGGGIVLPDEDHVAAQEAALQVQGQQPRRGRNRMNAVVAAPVPPDKAVVMALLEATRDSEPTVSQNAYQALAGFRTAAVPIYVEAMSSESAVIRQGALSAISGVVTMLPGYASMTVGQRGGRGGRGGGFGGGGRYAAPSSDPQTRELQATIAPVVVKALEDTDAGVRQIAAESITYLIEQPQIVVPALVRMLGSEDYTMRVRAVEGLRNNVRYRGADRITEHLPAVIKLLSDRDITLRGNAIVLLGECGTAARSAVPELLKAMKDEDANVRAAAATALGQIQAPPRPAVVPDEF